MVIEEDQEDDVVEGEVKDESATGIPMPPRDGGGGEPADGLISCSPLSNVTSVTETDTGGDDSGSDRYGLTNEIVFKPMIPPQPQL